MSLLVVIPLILGWLIARRLLKIEDPLEASVTGLSLGLVLSLLGVNGLIGSFGLSVALMSTLGVQLVFVLLLLKQSRPPIRSLPLHRGVLLALVLCTLFNFLYSQTQQTYAPDDDYWIHTPLQGLMLHENFPLTNPFFSDIPMNGHYGRNLCVVSVARLLDIDIFRAQMHVTTVTQMLIFLLLFCGLRAATGSQSQGLLASVLIFYGINVGGRGGMMDTLQNNNSLVYLYAALLFALIPRMWKGCTFSALLAGLTLGSYAMVYETHFGLFVLSLISAAPLLAFRGKIGKKELALTCLCLSIAIPLAMTQGGPITDLTKRGRVSDKVSKGMLNQAQVVTIDFPKEELFCLKLADGGYQRVSCAYKTPLLGWLNVGQKGQGGYQAIWTWDVLKIHFLPLYLFPFWAFVLWREVHPAGTLLAAFGINSFLIPAVVDFGPVYESEYFRWQFAAGFAMAGCLGLALGVCYDRLVLSDETPMVQVVSPFGLDVALDRRLPFCVCLFMVIILDTLSCKDFLLDKLRVAVFRIPPIQQWVASHPVLDFQPIDWEAATWLSGHSLPGQRMLTNFREENAANILFESTLTGVAGVRCVGHALPLDHEAIGTTPFHASPAARAFWETLDPDHLAALRADWVYFRPSPERSDLEGVVGLTLAHRQTLADGQTRDIYRVETGSKDSTGTRDTTPWPLQCRLEGVPPHSRAGEVHPAVLHIRNPNDDDITIRNGRMVQEIRRAGEEQSLPIVDGVTTKLDLVVKSRKTASLPISIVAPLNDGVYDVDFWLTLGSESRPLPVQPRLVVDFRDFLASLELREMTLKGKPESGRIFPVRVRLAAAPGDQPGPQKLHANVSAWDFAKREYVLAPEVNRVDLVLEFDEVGKTELNLSAMMPHTPGLYRLDLWLSEAHGHDQRYMGPEIEVLP